MRILELDMENGSLKDTPARVAKMYVIEAEHLCIASRGISDAGSATITGIRGVICLFHYIIAKYFTGNTILLFLKPWS